MATATKIKAPSDLQGGKPPKKPARGREPLLNGQGKTPAAKGKSAPKKPRGAAGIPVVEDDAEGQGTGANAPSELGPVKTLFVAIDSIDASPTNPRQHFDPAAIDELAESIKAVGLLQPILVRPRLHRYQIVAGERRWRAAKAAGLEQIEVKCRSLNDWQTLRVQWTENAERSDINEIEEALHFQRMLDARPGLTQQQLASDLGTSQAQVANRLRLLELPKAWQQRVISQEITASHARELVPFVRHTQALEQLVDAIEEDGVGSVKRFRDLIEDEVRVMGVKLNDRVWDSAAGKWIDWAVPLTDDERERWGVIEIKDRGGQPHLYAIPCNEAQQARDQARQFRIDEARKKAEKRAAKIAAAKPGESSAETASRRDEQFRKRLAAWRTDWLRVLCAERMKEPDNARIAEIFFLAMVQEPFVWEKSDPFEQIVDRIPTAPKGGWGSGSLYERVRACATAVELDELRITMACSLLVDEDNDPLQLVEHGDVEDLADELELLPDLEAIWMAKQAGDLSEAYWALHTKEQLEALGEELRVEFRETSKKGMVEQLVETLGLKLPAELGGSKGQKRKRKGS
ncbi:MAG: ParB/RepB/Spo0J family partition protein [Planctomycetaceae bacterium]|nr:ParB/RepB/Spo0J family partition protein [Planctomycetaceae bacterium]